MKAEVRGGEREERRGEWSRGREGGGVNEKVKEKERKDR
jgi:hypothetical protein